MRALQERLSGPPPQFAVFCARSAQRPQSSTRGPVSSYRVPSQLDNMALGISGLKGWVFQVV
jgi:hypothetical protein